MKPAAAGWAAVQPAGVQRRAPAEPLQGMAVTTGLHRDEVHAGAGSVQVVCGYGFARSWSSYVRTLHACFHSHPLRRASALGGARTWRCTRTAERAESVAHANNSKT